MFEAAGMALTLGLVPFLQDLKHHSPQLIHRLKEKEKMDYLKGQKENLNLLRVFRTQQKDQSEINKNTIRSLTALIWA